MPDYENEVPNLDAMSEAELDTFFHRFGPHARRRDQAKLVGKRPNYTKIAASLAAYANNKSVAMACRRRGDIQAAGIYETICDNIYDRLPDDLQW